MTANSGTDREGRRMIRPLARNRRLRAAGRVLVVDDHRQARESMADVLRQSGHEVGLLLQRRRGPAGAATARRSIAWSPT